MSQEQVVDSGVVETTPHKSEKALAEDKKREWRSRIKIRMRRPRKRDGDAAKTIWRIIKKTPLKEEKKSGQRIIKHAEELLEIEGIKEHDTLESARKYKQIYLDSVSMSA